ncbi:MAG: S9 family peptidase [Planctomycetes bacterium]|nr:S9 family peptidase [Planctomycetota bacterium]
MTADLGAQAAASGKRAVTHDDYDVWPSIRSATYSPDGKWMAYQVQPRIGDGVLRVRQVDGDKVWEFPRGESLQFANDNRRAFFKVGKSYRDERRKSLEKLYASKPEEKGGGSSEAEGELPPDIKAALAERGMNERMARRMMERRGSSLAEVRQFLGLPEPEAGKSKAAAKKPTSKKSPEEEAAEKEAKALQKRLHVLDLTTGEVTPIEQVKSHRQPKESNLLVLHFEAPEKPKPAAKDEKDETAAKTGEEKAGEPKPEEPKTEEPKTEEPRTERPGRFGGRRGGGRRGGEPRGEPRGEAPAGSDDARGKKREDGTKLVIRDLAGDSVDVEIEHVRSFGFVADDTWLWYQVGTKADAAETPNGLFARELATGRTVAVLAGYSNVSGIATDHGKTRVAFTSDVAAFADKAEEDDNNANEKDAKDDKESRNDIYLWDLSDQPALCIVTDDTTGIPAEHRIQRGGLGFSRDGSVLTFGVRAPKKPELPKILGEDEVKLDIWHWQDGQLQTMQAKRSDPEQATLMAVYHLDGNRAVALGTADSPRLTLITDDGSRALLADSKPYEQMVTWDGRYSDYYIVNTIDGSRRQIIAELRGSARASTGGNYVIWFDPRDYDWHVYDLRSSTSRNLTSDIKVAFDREQDDRPEPHNAYGVAGWTAGDAEVLLHDEFDVWAVNPQTGAYRCVTDGLGRATNTELRVTRIDLRPDSERERSEEEAEENPEGEDPEDERFLAGQLVLKATNQDTYAQGYYLDSLDEIGRPRKLIMKECSIGNPTRPRDADRLFLSFQRFDEFPDIWTTDLAFAGARQLTDACPMIDELRWGSAEIVRWESDDGVDLKGYLVKPDGFDPKQKYPMMVYFYERSSARIHSFVSPTYGTSPNAAYYVSNGYLWFVPDIVYREGYPGESCEKCVVSGVQHLIAQGFVDRKAIGVAGHSWGGYQTAHLVTRTDIFAAAESGAPVVNMFSAYGGIRWGTGMSRQFQYEQTQSRIGGTIWERPMQYWENSPLFHLDKVHTPVLILHNDKDGAVPWYQGIEFFTAMRRLGKEAYLFNYNGEDHGLRQRQNQRDWTRRMQEFFDHHLKGAPAPDWMQKGVPYHERMAEKIPFAPSYREAVDAGIIKPNGEPIPAPAEHAEAGEAAEASAEPTPSTVEAGSGSGAGSGGNQR